VPGNRFPSVEMSRLRSVKRSEYAIRFMLGAFVSVGAAIFAKHVSARFGGTFLAFPAILPASLTLLQSKQGARQADRDAVGAVLGGLALTVFAGVVEATLGHLNPYAALALALLIWLTVSTALYALLAFLHPDTCDRTRD